MFVVLERRRMGSMDLLGRSLKGRNLLPFLPSLRERISARPRDLSQSVSLLTCFGQGDERGASEPDVTALAFDNCAQNPARGTAGRRNQIQSSAVGDPARFPAAFKRLDRARAQCSLRMSSHIWPLFAQITVSPLWTVDNGTWAGDEGR